MNNGYVCPNCGKSATIVWKTRTYPKYIIRSRKCLACGHRHETAETAGEISDFWSKIRAIIAAFMSNNANSQRTSPKP